MSSISTSLTQTQLTLVCSSVAYLNLKEALGLKKQLSAQRTCSLISLKVSYKSLWDFPYFWGSLVFTWLRSWRRDWFGAAPITPLSDTAGSSSLQIRQLGIWQPGFWMLAAVQPSGTPTQKRAGCAPAAWPAACLLAWLERHFISLQWMGHIFIACPITNSPFCWTEGSVAISWSYI